MNKLTSEQFQNWSTQGVPVQDFYTEGPAVVVIIRPFPENFQTAIDKFIRLLMQVERPPGVGFGFLIGEVGLLFIHEGRLVGISGAYDWTQNAKLASSIQTIPHFSKDRIAKFFTGCGEVISWSFLNRSKDSEGNSDG